MLALTPTLPRAGEGWGEGVCLGRTRSSIASQGSQSMIVVKIKTLF